MIITPNVFTDIFEEELQFEGGINEETLKKFIRNNNFLVDLIPLGTIIWININYNGVNQPDAYYFQLCDGSEITASHSPLKTNSTLPDEKKRTPNLLNTFVKFSPDANQNEIINLGSVEVKAKFSELFAGLLVTIKLSANTGGQIGNAIVLTGDGTSTVQDLAAAWNAANANNKVTVGQGGGMVTSFGTLMQLSGGRNASGERGSQFHNIAHNHATLGSAGPGWSRDGGDQRRSSDVHTHTLETNFSPTHLMDSPKYMYLTPYIKIV